MTIEANPVLVEVTRGDIVETRHRGSIAIISFEGEVIGSYGNIDEPVFMRSATKPMQGIQLIESGAADFFNLTEKEISVGCSSHYAEDYHEEAVTNWLERIGLSLNDLECGPPAKECDNNQTVARRGLPKAMPVHNNCSGKHANFLTVCKHLGFPLKNYIDVNHPVQQLVTKTLGEMTGAKMSLDTMAIEGCGVPAFAFTRREGAIGYGRFSYPKCLPEKRANACRRIIKAMLNHPEYYGNKTCWDSTSTKVLNGVISKQGNRGTQMAMIPALKIGIVMKVDDGQTFAKECAMGAIFKALGLVNEEQETMLGRFLYPDIINARDEVVGGTRPNQEWVESLQELSSKVKFDSDWFEKL